MSGESEADESRDATAPNDIPNAADHKAISRAKTVRKFKDDQKAEFWRMVMASDIGRLVMWETLVAMHTFETRFAATPAGFSCPEATWFNAGERASGERLYDALKKADFAAVHEMHTEFDPYFIDRKPRRTKIGD